MRQLEPAVKESLRNGEAWSPFRRCLNRDSAGYECGVGRDAASAQLATRNVRHFNDTGLSLVNPFPQDAGFGVHDQETLKSG